jgi:hypothetical protein
MVVITNTQGQVVHRSRNLRGIVDHARRVGLASACADPSTDGRGRLCVTFADATSSRVEFASYTALCNWLHARRAWSGARSIAGSTPF